jgi:hypothetical protein
VGSSRGPVRSLRVLARDSLRELAGFLAPPSCRLDLGIALGLFSRCPCVGLGLSLRGPCAVQGPLHVQMSISKGRERRPDRVMRGSGMGHVQGRERLRHGPRTGSM